MPPVLRTSTREFYGDRSKYCNLCCLFHLGMVDYTKHNIIWKCCNLCRYSTVPWSTTRNKYGSAVIYTVISPWHDRLHETNMEVLLSTLFISPWHGWWHETNMEMLVSLPFFSVVVCAWLTTWKMHWRLASVGLTPITSLPFYNYHFDTLWQLKHC